jgi:hypothetical protein
MYRLQTLAETMTSHDFFLSSKTFIPLGDECLSSELGRMMMMEREREGIYIQISFEFTNFWLAF